MKGASATIDGVPIKGAAGWAIQAGTLPYMATFTVDRDGMSNPADLMGKPMTLTAEGIGGTWSVAGLYLVDYAPGSDPYNWSITLADKRYWWPRKAVVRRYNMRRRTGSTRLLREGFPTQLPQGVDDVAYELATLKTPGETWKAKDALLDIITILDGTPPVPDKIPTRNVPLDDVELDDDGAGAVTRLLRHIPGCAVYVDATGTTRFFDETDGSAADVLRAMGDAVVGKGIAEAVDYSGIRPTDIDALWTMEVELKFTSIDEGGTYSTRGNTTKYLENVLQVTDETLVVAGRTVTRGTWITFDEAFAAWGSFAAKNGVGAASSAGNISHEMVRSLWFGGALERMYTQLGALKPDANWLPRIREIRKHYRQTYRISPYWMNRIRSLRAERVAIIDPETGTRAPARVVCNYAVAPSVRGILFSPATQGVVLNVTDVYSDDLATAGYAPATVSILSNDLGILHLSFETGVNNILAEVFPCAFEEPIPQANFAAKAAVNIFGDGTHVRSVAPARLASNHKVAIVLTAVPSAPNSNDQLYRHRVSAGASPLAPGTCRGKPWEVRMGSGIATARFAWSDRFESMIDKVFGVPQNPMPGVAPTYAGGDALAGAGLLVDKDEIVNLSKATAAAVYAQLVDRIVGTQAGPPQADLNPTGSATAILHGIDANGPINTLVRFDRTSGRLDPQTFIDNNTRRKLFRMVQP